MNAIFDPSKPLRYGFYSPVFFKEERLINKIEHVVMTDRDGNEKVVYKNLFVKHAKVIIPKNRIL